MTESVTGSTRSGRVSKRVLFFDDHVRTTDPQRAQIAQIREKLEHEGYEVKLLPYSADVAADAREIRKWILDWKPDLLLLDLDLGGKNGAGCQVFDRLISLQPLNRQPEVWGATVLLSNFIGRLGMFDDDMKHAEGWVKERTNGGWRLYCAAKPPEGNEWLEVIRVALGPRAS